MRSRGTGAWAAPWCGRASEMLSHHDLGQTLVWSCTTNILNMVITSILLRAAGLLRSFSKALSSNGRNSSHGIAALSRSREGFFLVSFASRSPSSHKPCWPTLR